MPTKLGERVPHHARPDRSSQQDDQGNLHGTDSPDGTHPALTHLHSSQNGSGDIPSAAERMLHMQEAAASLHDMQVTYWTDLIKQCLLEEPPCH